MRPYIKGKSLLKITSIIALFLGYFALNAVPSFSGNPNFPISSPIKSTKINAENLSKVPIIYNVKLVESNKARMLYNVIWDYKNISSNERVKIALLKNNSYYCYIRRNVTVGSKAVGVSMDNICQNKPEPNPADADKKIFKVEVILQNNQNVRGTSEVIELPIYPELKITGISRNKRKGYKSYFYFYTVKVKNVGLKHAKFVWVHLKLTDLDKNKSVTLVSGGYQIKHGEEMPAVFGITPSTYDPLINAKHEKVEVSLSLSAGVKEYNENDDHLVAEFNDVKRVR